MYKPRPDDVIVLTGSDTMNGEKKFKVCLDSIMSIMPSLAGSHSAQGCVVEVGKTFLNKKYGTHYSEFYEVLETKDEIMGIVGQLIKERLGKD